MIDETMMQAIGVLGFPIVMCLLLFWQNTKVMREMTKAVNNLRIYLEQKNASK